LLVAPLVAGLTAAAIVTANVRLYPILLLADLWLLGYHHVVATYTRLAFDGQSLRRNRFLAIDLLLIVTGVTLVVAMTAGAWVIASAFLYLQWFHYMRQGYGIARMYFRATAQGASRGARLGGRSRHLPGAGLRHRRAIGDDGRSVPRAAGAHDRAARRSDHGAGGSGSVAGLVWAGRTLRAALTEGVDLPYTCFIASHVAIFMMAYVVIADANAGWLCINVWHNFQYVLVVWMANAKRYAGGIDPTAKLLSRISQPGRVVAYFATCLGSRRWSTAC
jgi:hypothetical protein